MPLPIRRKLALFSIHLGAVGLSAAAPAEPTVVWLESLNLETMETGWGQPQANATVNGQPLRLGGQVLPHGVGTHANSEFAVDLHGTVVRFEAVVGIDNEVGENHGSVNFKLMADGVLVFESGVLRETDAPQTVKVDLRGRRQLLLLVDDGNDNSSWDHADWAMAKFTLAVGSTLAPEPLFQLPSATPMILTPPPSRRPRINGPTVYGARAGAPFQYLVPATGEEPIRYTATNLPDGLVLDPASGIITGIAPRDGTYPVALTASNQLGHATKRLTLKIGDTIALTPPLGWNSWNCFADNIDESIIKTAADRLVQSGLSRHGWSYVNIDDGWQGARTADGEIHPRAAFPDLKALADYIHAKGLKFGLYSSPGSKTCTNYEGSLGHEAQDARTYAAWDVDYLKYDWCSCRNPDLKAPYRLMQDQLRSTRRDIFFSLCQYGMGEVWRWGASVGGNAWRTDGDINDSWGSLNIGFRQNGMERFAGPGHWNDPDMMIIGWVSTGTPLHSTRLRPDEQYTHVTLWSIMAAPLLIGCDLTRLDDFTRSLLSNDEVLEIDQDELGQQGRRLLTEGKTEIWVKELADGGHAVAFFNRGLNRATISLPFASLNLNRPQLVRDLWRQQDLGVEKARFTATVAPHGTVFVKLTEASR